MRQGLVVSEVKYGEGDIFWLVLLKYKVRCC